MVKKKKEILKQSNFLVFPSNYKYEILSNVTLESFMFGSPVFTYDTGALREIVSKDFLGFVSSGDWKELSAEIIKRIGKKTESNKIRKYFKDNFILEIAEKKLVNIFNKELFPKKQFI